jgi:hypothetical protein
MISGQSFDPFGLKARQRDVLVDLQQSKKIEKWNVYLITKLSFMARSSRLLLKDKTPASALCDHTKTAVDRRVDSFDLPES